MLSASPPQRIAEISNELENICVLSLDRPNKAAKMYLDGLKITQLSLKKLTLSAGGL
jgi:hypothetical protein